MASTGCSRIGYPMAGMTPPTPRLYGGAPRPGSSRRASTASGPQHSEDPPAATPAAPPSRPSAREVPAMKFRVERDVLADAAAWVARSLP
ncbi:MAG: hypothetical protein ACRDQ0_23830, partial [Pseudonocardia sp.]